MLELQLTSRDLAHTRFSLSPLWEVIASVQVLKHPGTHPVHAPWAAQTRPRLANLEWSTLSALVPVPSPVLPGFLAPPQPTTVADLELELTALSTVPSTEVRRGLRVLPGDRSAPLALLYDDPPAGLTRLADEIRAYWRVALASHWPRILALLEGDVRHRAQLLVEGGVHRLLNDLDPAIRWADDRLLLAHRSTSGQVRLGGRGLLLAPSVFIWPRIASVVAPPWQPTLRYPPRGVGTLWEQRYRDPPAALAGVLGRTRAQLLTTLDQPASTSELARATGISAGGVSQHLTALRAAGLVAGHRSGRYVRYARTRAAEALLAASATS